jgi:hypothetical protein
MPVSGRPATPAQVSVVPADLPPPPAGAATRIVGQAKAARAHAQTTGLAYTAAVRQTRHRDGGLSALGVHTDLMQTLQRAGWPVEFDTVAETVQ